MEYTSKPTDEWYTPIEIINALGSFDLDPCSPVNRLWDTAKEHYTKIDNGLIKEWKGRIWLNPPYSYPLISLFMQRMAKHRNGGIALLFNHLNNSLFYNHIFPYADSILLLRKRIKFYRADGTQGERPAKDSVLIAYGKENTRALLNSRLPGVMLKNYKKVR